MLYFYLWSPLTRTIGYLLLSILFFFATSTLKPLHSNSEVWGFKFFKSFKILSLQLMLLCHFDFKLTMWKGEDVKKEAKIGELQVLFNYLKHWPSIFSHFSIFFCYFVSFGFFISHQTPFVCNFFYDRFCAQVWVLQVQSMNNTNLVLMKKWS